jgi:stage II sporulation protein D (peptidoglycan lytic transglycosylase)
LIANRRNLGGWIPAAAALVILTGTLTCTPQETPELTPSPVIASPEIRIGLSVGASRVELQGDSGLTILDADGVAAGTADPGAVWLVASSGQRLSAQGQGSKVVGQGSLTFEPRTAGGLVALNGRWYRGRLTVARDRTGLTAINIVPIEDYLIGVIAAEMGKRDSSEAEALAAQAIISRTFAIRNLGKRASDGFDLLPTVVDQAYGGVAAEYPLARWAVAHTGGQVVTWQGAPIDAFFFSTCAGQTATGTEVFAAADRPYLVSVRDLDSDGRPYCSISPRYRWTEVWTGEQLRGILRQSLPAAAGATSEQLADLRGVRVTQRTGSDRVSRITIVLARGPIEVSGPAVRQVLHPVGQPSLRSAIFQLLETREGERLSRLVAEGAGAGHGVGFCQWGAVGRAREGQDASAILGAYFPGTLISRAY